MPAPLLSWLCHALQDTASSCLYVREATSSQDVASRIWLSTQGAATLSSNAFTWHVCLLPHEGQFFVVQLPVPEVEGIPSRGCIGCGHVPERITAFLYSMGLECCPCLQYMDLLV